LTAYQQLRHIIQQLLQEQRRCQATIHRTKWKLTAGRRSGSSSSSVNASKRWSPGSSHPASSTASQQEDDELQQQGLVGSASTAAELNSTESAQLMHLRQLRAKCDDAQDYLVGLIHAHLQVRASAVAAHANIHIVTYDDAVACRPLKVPMQECVSSSCILQNGPFL
jgi:hypothetical protein